MEVRQMLSVSQHQFCTHGYIAATGEPLLACSYENLNDLNNYHLIPLGSSKLNDHWVRLPPTGKITTDAGDVIVGVTTIEPQYINGQNVYFSRTSMCSYMRGCYNHDAGWDYEFCQEYWNTEVKCEPVKRFYQNINPGVLLYIGVAIALIILLIAITALFLTSDTMV
jgi:hypothetical protein